MENETWWYQRACMMCVVLLMSKTLEWWSWSKLVKASDSLYPAGTYATFSVAARHLLILCVSLLLWVIAAYVGGEKKGVGDQHFCLFYHPARINTRRYSKYDKKTAIFQMNSDYYLRAYVVPLFNSSFTSLFFQCYETLLYFIIWNMVMICTSVQWKIYSSCSDCFV